MYSFTRMPVRASNSTPAAELQELVAGRQEILSPDSMGRPPAWAPSEKNGILAEDREESLETACRS
jgi:hypothetical protein